MSRPRIAAFVLLLSALGFLAGVLAGRQIELNQADDRLAGHNARLLAHALRVAQEGHRLMAAATQGGALCSEADVATLRVLLFNSTYIRDIGRTLGGMLRCSAAWGKLPEPLALPPPAFTVSSGLQLWVGAANIVDRRIIGDMASLRDVIVFTAPGAFDGFPEPGSGIDAKIVTRDGSHVYRRFGRAHDLDVPADGDAGHGLGFAPERRAWLCAPDGGPDICVVSRLRSDAWFQLPAMVMSVVGALALAFLAGLCVMWRLHAGSARTELRKAILAGDIQVHYQPLRQLATRQLAGFEALARWRARGRDVSPILFVPLAEAMGLGRALSRLVTSQALRDLHERLRDNPALYVSINVSAADLKDAGYRNFLMDAVSERGLMPANVALEITEGTPLSDGHVLAMVKALRGKGFKVFIDDFGTGHSNLNYLAELQADAIKLDRSFTSAIGEEEAGTLIVDHVIAISRELGINLIIEGIETEAQASYLLARQPAAVGQGWLFGRPVPLSDIVAE
ncbi:EAL domain-containing protein [Achromobacter mucicolens]|uniref:EAL domain-containing protein n=1 Tax=Achromobacter mucicolens TaxID=1389922 RepID=UPI001CC0199B|nr:EAL domain-containing protein [Achromobacter mucicolens]